MTGPAWQPARLAPRRRAQGTAPRPPDNGQLCSSALLLLLFLLLLDVPGGNAQDSAVTISIQDSNGDAITILTDYTSSTVRLDFLNMSEHIVAGALRFVSPAPAAFPDWVVPFNASACAAAPAPPAALRLACPFPPSPGPLRAAAAPVTYHLGAMAYSVDGGAPVSPAPLPAVWFEIPGRVTVAAALFQSDLLVLSVAPASQATLGTFNQEEFLSTLRRECLLPDDVAVAIAGVREASGNMEQVTVVLEAAYNLSEVFKALFLMLNNNRTVQVALSLVPPVLLGTWCPKRHNVTCSGVGSCQFLDGSCTCLDQYEGDACEQANPSAYPSPSYVIAIVILCAWALGWAINRVLWVNDQEKRRKRETFLHLSPLHRTTRGTMIYRNLAAVYLGLCVAGCALPPTSPWYAQASDFALPQILRYLRLAIPNVPYLPYVAYVAVGVFVPYCIYLNKRLTFLVDMDIAAWHHSLDAPATRRLASMSMTWSKPRFRPPGYTPHYALLLVHLFYPTLAPLIFSLLMSTFACDRVDARWVYRMDYTVGCFERTHVIHAAISGLALLAYYSCFVASSFIFVAATERMQHRNLELGLPSLIRDKRAGFLVKTQVTMVLIGADVFVSQMAVPAFVIAGIAACGATAVLLLVYQFRDSPCNIPLCNWVSVASFLFPLWCYILVIPAFLIPTSGLPMLLEVLLGLLVSHIVSSVVIIAVMRHYARGIKGEAPTWFAVRMAEATRREQTVLCRYNTARHLSKEELDIDLSHLPTPRSVPPSSPRRGRSLAGPSRSPARRQSVVVAAAASEATPPEQSGLLEMPPVLLADGEGEPHDAGADHNHSEEEATQPFEIIKGPTPAPGDHSSGGGVTGVMLQSVGLKLSHWKEVPEG